MEEYPIERDWVGCYDTAPSCQYNNCVGCLVHRCETCGWNPFVSLERVVSKYGADAAEFLTSPSN